MEELLRYAPGVIGFLAPFVAAISSLFQNKSIRVVFFVFGLLLGAASFGANVYSERVKTTESVRVNNQLSTFIEEGGVLGNYILASPPPFDQSPYRTWIDSTEVWLKANLGEPYLRRYRNSPTGLVGHPGNLPTERFGYYEEVRKRMARLEVFISERR